MPPFPADPEPLDAGPVRVSVAGETFCANCGETYLPYADDPHPPACCAVPRIVSLAAYLRPEEIA
jgi:hypothetical protein